jgi:hypothetical protein
VPPKKGDRVAPPPPPGGWEVRYADLEPWQYEVTAGGRIWYCPNPKRRIVWLTQAGTGHPKITE